VGKIRRIRIYPIPKVSYMYCPLEMRSFFGTDRQMTYIVSIIRRCSLRSCFTCYNLSDWCSFRFSLGFSPVFSVAGVRCVGCWWWGRWWVGGVGCVFSLVVLGWVSNRVVVSDIIGGNLRSYHNLLELPLALLHARRSQLLVLLPLQLQLLCRIFRSWRRVCRKLVVGVVVDSWCRFRICPDCVRLGFEQNCRDF
jgi:hypothetical protein